jgi:hypothetical protein
MDACLERVEKPAIAWTFKPIRWFILKYISCEYGLVLENENPIMFNGLSLEGGATIILVVYDVRNIEIETDIISAKGEHYFGLVQEFESDDGSKHVKRSYLPLKDEEVRKWLKVVRETKTINFDINIVYKDGVVETISDKQVLEEEVIKKLGELLDYHEKRD